MSGRGEWEGGGGVSGRGEWEGGGGGSGSEVEGGVGEGSGREPRSTDGSCMLYVAVTLIDPLFIFD